MKCFSFIIVSIPAQKLRLFGGMEKLWTPVLDTIAPELRMYLNLYHCKVVILRKDLFLPVYTYLFPVWNKLPPSDTRVKVQIS